MSADKTQAVEHILLYRDLFVARTDIYAKQYVHGGQNGYVAVREPLTDELIQRHLLHEITLGLYALSPASEAKLLAIDIDSTVLSEIAAVEESARTLDLPPPLMEYSGRRGYHMLWFFIRPVPGWQARALGLAVAQGRHEVFPKASTVSSTDSSRPGSLLKGPLGLHCVSGKPSVFVDEGFKEIPDPWGVLQSVQKVDISKYSQMLRMRVKQSAMFPTALRTNQLRPCIETVLRDGCREGFRNETGHLIAVEMRRLGRSKPETAGVLSTWNLRNVPRLTRAELRLVLEGAYSGKLYSYGCAPDGHLRRILECVGETCPIWDRKQK
jgi:hypothetical protein